MRKLRKKFMIDAMDEAILRLLTANGRVSYSAMEERLGITRVAIRERVKSMEMAGVICLRGHIPTGILALGEQGNRKDRFITYHLRAINRCISFGRL